MLPGQNIKQKPCYNKFNKDFKKIVNIKKKESLLKIWLFAKSKKGRLLRGVIFSNSKLHFLSP